MKEMEGKIVTISTIGYKIYEDDACYIWDKRAFELPNIKPTKEKLLELPMGTKITTDLDEDNVFVKTGKDRFENRDSVIDEYKIEDNLFLLNRNNGTKILKIEVPTYETIYDSSKEVKEMTIAEISKALGYKVIIKEE